MKRRKQAARTSGGRAGTTRMAMASAAPKRMATAKKSAPKKVAKKPAPAAKKAGAAAKKPAPVKKPAAPVAKPAPAAPRLATPLPSNGGAAAVKPQAQPARPAAAPAPARPGNPGTLAADEKRRQATRKFFARLRSLEAIVGADLRKRGSLVLMQAVDQWYSEAISATATDVSITNAAKAVITHL